MQYLGGKARIAKHIVPFMEMFYRRDHEFWVEPFMGACNTLALASGPKIGNDIDPDLVGLFKALQQGFDPPREVTEEEYYKAKNNPELYPVEVRGFLAFACSFGGKKWGSFAHNTKGENFAQQAANSLSRKMQGLMQASFTAGQYFDLDIPPQSFIYCDPPYLNTARYRQGIDHESFWEWCRLKSREGHTVLVSEYTAPSDFEIITSSIQTTWLHKSHKVARENIYKWKGAI